MTFPNTLKALLLFFALLLPCYAHDFLWLSDIHFDPFADPTLVDKLAAGAPAEWPSILNTPSAKFPAFGKDTTWPLLSSAIQTIRKAQPKAAFTIVTGDLLAHHFREQFDNTASVHDDAAFRSFIRKTMQFVGLQLKSIHPGKPVIVALGNNDDSCADYGIQPNGPFLEDTSQFIATWSGTTDTASYKSLGSYALPNPAIKNARIIVLNTILFSSKYKNRCGPETDDPAARLLTWLEANLKEAHAKHQKVWLAYHIPPGVDAFASSRSKAPADVTLLWKESYANAFTSLMNQYASVVGPNFAGHVHIDDFRLLGASTPAFVMSMPALSPNIRQNPAFRVVTFDSKAQLLDQSTYFLKNLADSANGQPPAWALEYGFQKQWALKTLNSASLAELYSRLGDSSSGVATQWTLFYAASNPADSSLTPANFRQYYCVIDNQSPTAYRACVGQAEAAK